MTCFLREMVRMPQGTSNEPETDGSPQPLPVLLEAASQSLLSDLTKRLHARGYDTITKSHLIIYGNLDCGATHAALIAQRMGVSRQAISKTLRELQDLGFLRLEDDPERRNQKRALMTHSGELLALAAREEIASIEAMIAERIGVHGLEALRRGLEEGLT